MSLYLKMESAEENVFVMRCVTFVLYVHQHKARVQCATAYSSQRPPSEEQFTLGSLDLIVHKGFVHWYSRCNG